MGEHKKFSTCCVSKLHFWITSRRWLPPAMPIATRGKRMPIFWHSVIKFATTCLIAFPEKESHVRWYATTCFLGLLTELSMNTIRCVAMHPLGKALSAEGIIWMHHMKGQVSAESRRSSMSLAALLDPSIQPATKQALTRYKLKVVQLSSTNQQDDLAFVINKAYL